MGGYGMLRTLGLGIEHAVGFVSKGRHNARLETWAGP